MVTSALLANLSSHKTLVVGVTFIARVEEIVQVLGSVADYSRLPDGVLLQSADVNRPDEKYRMPHIDLLNQWSFVRFEVCLSCSLLFCGSDL